MAQEAEGSVSATCEYCQQEMARDAGCSMGRYSFPDGTTETRLPFDGDGRNCHDCNVGRGQLHHPGCDAEDCPRCGGQAISCDCTREPCDHCGSKLCMDDECLEDS